MSKYVTQAGWDHAPHLTAAAKEDLLKEIPPYQRDARSKGIPMLGRGAIYPVPESDFVVAPFPIPEHWTRGYGLDVGWNRTAVVWGACDREHDTIYLDAEHYAGRMEPALNAAAIRAKGDWLQGVIDPASRGRAQDDGNQLLQNYIDLGLNLDIAENGVEAGLQIVWTRLVSGRLKVFNSLGNWLWEFRKYQRDEHGHVRKQDDHAMDACLTAETLIRTSAGDIAIAALVGESGTVLSRSGSWARFCGARRTIENAPVVELLFEDGSTVKCTYDHPYLTPRDGWVRAIDMEGLAAYDGVSQCVHRERFLRAGAFRSLFLRPSVLRSLDSTASAQTTARPSSARRLAWTMRNVLAWFAAAALWRISTSRNKPARQSATLRCVSVTEAGSADVYCLTVPGSQSFCLANGAVVHNTRYLLSPTGIQRMTTKPVPRGPNYGAGGIGRSWMA